jgi:hypothetical protein
MSEKLGRKKRKSSVESDEFLVLQFLENSNCARVNFPQHCQMLSRRAPLFVVFTTQNLIQCQWGNGGVPTVSVARAQISVGACVDRGRVIKIVRGKNRKAKDQACSGQVEVELKEERETRTRNGHLRHRSGSALFCTVT